MKNNKDVVLAAVQRYGFALQYASDDMKNDQEVVMAAVQNNVTASIFASPIQG